MCKQLNEPVLKSLKTKRSGLKLKKKKLAGPSPGQNFAFRFGPNRARAEISISLSGRAGLGLKFQFLFLTGPVRARAEISFFASGRSMPRLQWCGSGRVRQWEIRPDKTSTLPPPNKRNLIKLKFFIFYRIKFLLKNVHSYRWFRAPMIVGPPCFAGFAAL